MIPYWHPGSLTLVEGILEFHVFGLLVGIGVITGTWLAQRRSKELGLTAHMTADLALWVVIVAFIFAHLVSLFAYFPERFFGSPCGPDLACPVPYARGAAAYVCSAGGRCNDGSYLSVFEIWNGISSFGGFLGAGIAFLTFFKMKKITVIPGLLELVGGKGRPVLRYIDSLAYGFTVGWFFGRMGCFSAHDHIGRATNSFLAVNFPDGFRASVPAVAAFGDPGFTTRFDLGFLELLFAGSLFLVFHFYFRKKKDLRPGFYAAVFMISYAPYRFFLDSLRATDIGGADKRYFADLIDPGLTPGQIGAFVVLFLGIMVWIRGGKAAANPDYVSGKMFTGEGWGEGGSKPEETETPA